MVALLSNTKKWLEKGTVTKKQYSCPANTAPFALFAMATNLFVVGTTTTQLWVSFHYLNIFPMCYTFLPQFRSPFVDLLHTVCVGANNK